MPLDRTITPPNGWMFYQPETNWRMPFPVHQTWASAVQAIHQHRLANPVLSAKSSIPQVEADLEAYTVRRLGLDKPAAAPVATAPAKRSGCGTCGSR